MTPRRPLLVRFDCGPFGYRLRVRRPGDLRGGDSVSCNPNVESWSIVRGCLRTMADGLRHRENEADLAAAAKATRIDAFARMMFDAYVQSHGGIADMPQWRDITRGQREAWTEIATRTLAYLGVDERGERVP